MGNGTYHGKFHELHFLHYENMTGYRALRNAYKSRSSENATLSGRKTLDKRISARYYMKNGQIPPTSNGSIATRRLKLPKNSWLVPLRKILRKLSMTNTALICGLIIPVLPTE